MSDFAAECKHLAAELERVTAALRREIEHRLTEHDGWVGTLSTAVEKELNEVLAGGARAAQEDK
jgi:hypothetical protein